MQTSFSEPPKVARSRRLWGLQGAKPHASATDLYNQKAHEVSRELTAWACNCLLRANYVWYRADPSASGFRPGPASARSA
jgi:hypothetical protein